jgi:hypothetical protein
MSYPKELFKIAQPQTCCTAKSKDEELEFNKQGYVSRTGLLEVPVVEKPKPKPRKKIKKFVIKD